MILDSSSVSRQIPNAKLSDQQNTGIINHAPTKRKRKIKFGKERFKNRKWLLMQKARRRRRGILEMPRDSKFTGRKRRPQF